MIDTWQKQDTRRSPSTGSEIENVPEASEGYSDGQGPHEDV